MDRNIRRALYTALVAGGLVVVGASSAHAAAEGLLDPVTQGATETIEEAPVAGGDLDAGTGAPPAGAGADAAADAAETDGDVVGREGIVRSLLSADVAGVVDGTLGEGGLVDDLLTGGPPDGVEEPGTEEPGTEEPGTEEPGTDPGTDGPGPVDPLLPGDPGAEEPGEGPGTDEPGADDPDTQEPSTGGADAPGNGGSGTGGPVPGDREAGPGPERHGTGGRVVDGRGTTEPGSTNSGGATSNGGPSDGPITARLGSTSFGAGTPAGTPGAEDAVPGVQEDHGAPADQPEDGQDLPGEGVDISWGDKADKAGRGSSSYDGTILVGDMPESVYDAVPEREEEAEAAPKVVPDDALPETGHLITGQLSLISLLLGLGIAALRMRRR